MDRGFGRRALENVGGERVSGNDEGRIVLCRGLVLRKRNNGDERRMGISPV